MIENIQALNDNEIQDVNGGIYSGPCFVYVVKKGDCLSVIAKHYHTTVDTIVALNNIRNRDLIYPGQRLLIPYF